jgi:hypothetical protein
MQAYADDRDVVRHVRDPLWTGWKAKVAIPVVGQRIQKL